MTTEELEVSRQNLLNQVAALQTLNLKLEVERDAARADVERLKALVDENVAVMGMGLIACRERDQLRKVVGELAAALQSSKVFVQSYKDSSPQPNGCVWCGFASKKCELDKAIENNDTVLATYAALNPQEKPT